MIRSGYIGQRWPAFLLVALAILGAVLVLLRNHPYGPAIVRHSTFYIGTAENLLAGEGWTVSQGGPYTTFAPLYPALLAALGFLSGFEPRAVAGPLNALLFGLTIFIAGHWLRQRIASRWLALWGILAIVFSPLTRMFEFAMAEPLFIFLTTAALFCMERFLREGRRAALIQAALLIGLVWLTRNAGGLLVISLAALLLLRPGARPLERMKHCAAFILIVGICVGPRLLHGLLVAGKPLGDSPPARHTMSDFLKTAFSSLKGWLTPGLPTEEAIALGAVMLAALATAFGFALVRRRPWPTFYLCAGLVLLYFILMGIIAKMTYPLNHQGPVSSHWMGHRYWTPIYIPLLMALVFLLDRWLIWPRGKPIRLLSFRFRPREALLALLLLIWLGGALELNRQDIIRASEGQDKIWANAEYVNDDLLHFIRETPAPGKIYINRRGMTGGKFVDLVHYHTKRPIRDLHILSAKRLEKARETVEAAAAGELLVWFYSADTPTPNPYSYGLAELDALPALERVANLSSGVVFRVRE